VLFGVVEVKLGAFSQSSTEGVEVKIGVY